MLGASYVTVRNYESLYTDREMKFGKVTTFGQAAEPGAAGLGNELPSEIIRKLLPG